MRRKNLLLLAVAAAALGAQAQATFTAGVLNYTVTGDNTVEVSGLADRSATVLDIPATVENDGVTYDVKAIGDEAFKWSGVKSAVLPASIDTIKHGAFNGSDLVTITLNEGLKVIGDYSLACKQLVTVDVPASVTEIGDNAFFAASNLSQVTLRDGLKKIGRSAFYNTALTGVAIPASVDTIGNTAFLYCRKLATATIAEGSLKYVGQGTFNGCTLLESVALPSTVEYIGLECFLGDVALTTLNIPASVKELGESFMAKTAIATIDLDPANTTYKLVGGVLYNMAGNVLVAAPMKGLTAYDIPAGVQGIMGGAFWGSEVANVTLPDGMVIIDDYAFCQSALAHIEFPASVIWVGEQAFASTQLTEVTLPENFPYINDGEFAGCTQLTRVEIPSSVMEVYPHAFMNCSRATFYCHGSKAPMIMDYYDDWDHPFYGTGGYAYVPSGARAAYAAADWDGQLTIRENELGTLLPVSTTPAEGGVVEANGDQAAPTFAFTFAEPVQLLVDAPAAFVRKDSFVSSTAMLPERAWTASLSDDGLTLLVSRADTYTVTDDADYYFTLPEGVVANEAGAINEHCTVMHTYVLGQPAVKGDLNGDGAVDVDDMNVLINIMLDLADYNAAADLDGNGEVDVDDLNALINLMLAD